jgi:hypothetical protein
MTALSGLQQEWASKEKGKMTTGVLLWDLSAAYDTICPLSYFVLQNSTIVWI